MNLDSSLNIKMNCLCNQSINNINSPQIIQCIGCSHYMHKECVNNAVEMDPFFCPSCQIQKSDIFIKTLQNILPPILLKNNPESPITTLQFFTNLIFPKSVLIIRCLQLDKDGFNMKWPEHCIISINDKVVESFTTCESSRKKVKHKEPIIFWGSDPFKKEITKDTYLNPYNQTYLQFNAYFTTSMFNRLSLNINWEKNTEKYDYVISIDEVESINSIDTVINSIIDYSKESEVLNMMNKRDIVTVNETISLIDIYTGNNRIELPVRGISCTHLGVFDLRNFLIFAKQTKRFNCPFCLKSTCILYIDYKMKKIIEERPETNSIVWDKELLKYSNDSGPIEIQLDDKTTTVTNEEQLMQYDQNDDSEIFDINSPLFSTNKVYK